MALEHWLQLALTDGVGPILLRRILESAGSPEAACEATVTLLRSVEGIGTAKADQIARNLRAAKSEATRQLDLANAQGVRIIPQDDPMYPALLRTIHDPPAVLFAKGELQDRDLNAIAMVGSRGCSFYGREQANRFGASLAGIGFTIISGGARGVDSAAHHGALSHPAGRTIAILGCGVDIVYPPENTALFASIAERGAVLSEFPMGTEPRPEHFPRRNRLVSGMSRAVLVVEADIKSGALITAHTACEQDRTVFALPGRVDNKLSSGPHKLIREGATLVTCIQDIVDGLTPLPAEVEAPTLFDDTPQPDSPPVIASSPAAPCLKPVVPLTAQQTRILDSISDAPTGVDFIVEQTTLPVHIILQELTMLSLKGLIQRVDGQTYSRR